MKILATIALPIAYWLWTWWTAERMFGRTWREDKIPGQRDLRMGIYLIGTMALLLLWGLIVQP